MNQANAVQFHGAHRTPFSSVASIGICLFLLSVIFWLLYWIDYAWVYSCIGWIDAWAYFGLAADPVAMRSAFPNHPAGDLLPLIWPAAFLYSVFPAIAANLLYKWASFVLVGLLLYRMVEWDFGKQTAIWATLALVFYKYFLIAVGSDYTDGRVILYLMLALYFLSTAYVSDASRKQEATRLFFGGLFFSFSVSTALLSSVFGLPLALCAIGRQWIKKGKIEIPWLALSILGFCVGILSLGLAHYLYTGRFLYFSATLAKATSFLNVTRGPQHVNVLRLEWLYLPLLACVALPMSLVTRESRNVPWGFEKKLSILLWVMNVGALLPLVYLQYVKKQETLINCYYLDQVLPFTMYAIVGTLIHPAIRQLGKTRFMVFTVIFFLVCLGVFAYTTCKPGVKAQWLTTLACVGLIAAVLLYCTSRKEAGWLTIFLTLFLWVNLSPEKIDRIWKYDGITPYCKSRRQALETSFRWVAFVKKVDPGRSRFLWYNGNGERTFFRGLSAASHLWQGRVLNECLPELDVPIGEVGVVDPVSLASRGVGLIVVAKDDVEVERARANLLKQGVQIEYEISTTFQVNDEKSLQVRVCRLITENKGGGAAP
jgi:hypothetical protein